MSEFRVLLENQQLDLVIQLTVSRDKFKDDARRSGVSIKAGYQRSTAAPVGPLTAVCLDFINENKKVI